MQGQLRNEYLSLEIETECALSQQPVHIEIDSNLSYRVVEPGANPVIFAPLVDFAKFKDPSIIDGF